MISLAQLTRLNGRSVALLVAAVLALGTGLLLFNYLAGINSAANKVEAKRAVLIASKPIAAQSPITMDMVERAVRPATSVEPDAIDPSQVALVVGTIAVSRIPGGGTITQSRVVKPAAAGLTTKLAPGTRAITISIDRVKGVAGLIQPGDRVDVIAVVSPRGNEAPTARTILRGIEVLALGTSLQATSASPTPDQQNVTTATLNVSPTQAALLTLADVNATLRLTLRSPREAVRSLPSEGITFATTPTIQNVVPHMPAAPRPASSERLAPAAVPVKPRVTGPVVIDGDKVVETGTSR